MSVTVTEIASGRFESTTDMDYTMTTSAAASAGDLLVGICAAENPAENSTWFYEGSFSIGNFWTKVVDTVNTNAGDYDIRFTIAWKRLSANLASGSDISLRFSSASDWTANNQSYNKRTAVIYKVEAQRGGVWIFDVGASAFASSKNKTPDSGSTAAKASVWDSDYGVVFGGTSMEVNGMPSSYAQTTGYGWPSSPQFDDTFPSGGAGVNLTLIASHHTGVSGSEQYAASWTTGSLARWHVSGVAAFYENNTVSVGTTTSTGDADARLEVAAHGPSTSAGAVDPRVGVPSAGTTTSTAAASAPVLSSEAQAGATATLASAAQLRTTASSAATAASVGTGLVTGPAVAGSTSVGTVAPVLRVSGAAVVSTAASSFPAGIETAVASAVQVTGGVATPVLGASTLAASTAAPVAAAQVAVAAASAATSAASASQGLTPSAAASAATSGQSSARVATTASAASLAAASALGSSRAAASASASVSSAASALPILAATASASASSTGALTTDRASDGISETTAAGMALPVLVATAVSSTSMTGSSVPFTEGTASRTRRSLDADDVPKRAVKASRTRTILAGSGSRNLVG